MTNIRLEDFTVDVVKRRVKHNSGAEISFYRYWNMKDWLRADCCMVRKSDKFDGSYAELAGYAKAAALQHGMRHH